MTRHHHILPIILLSCLLIPHASQAQVSQRDLESIERHRKPQQSVSVLQSIEDAQDASRWDSPLIGTWDFLDEEDKTENEYDDVPDIRIVLDRSTVAQRVGTLPQELLIPYNDALEEQIESYVIRHSKALRGIIGKYEYYEKAIRSTFRRYGIPEDLTALAIVESAMNPLALSKAGARGMWQFMPETAVRFGLKCGQGIDERLDPIKSADAAARYLKSAYNLFGDWPLAISSYNCGPGAVEKAIVLAGSTDFWSVYQYLPAETKGYMPAFIAALYTLNYYPMHGIVPRPYGEGQLSNFKITRYMTFAEIIRATGISRKDLARLNPQYESGYIPGNQKNYMLRLPKKYAKLFKDNIDVVDA